MVNSSQFRNTAQDASVVRSVQDSLAMFTGVAKALEFSNFSLIYPYLAKHSLSFTHLMELYRTIPEVKTYLLDFYEKFTSACYFSLLNLHDLQFIYAHFSDIILRSRSPEMMVSRSTTDRESVYEDVLTMIKIVSNIIQSDTQDNDDSSLARNVACEGLLLLANEIDSEAMSMQNVAK